MSDQQTSQLQKVLLIDNGNNRTVLEIDRTGGIPDVIKYGDKYFWANGSATRLTQEVRYREAYYLHVPQVTKPEEIT